MKPLAVLSVTLLAAVLVTPPARAGGTIDALQYMPIGAFNAWEMVDKALWADGAGVKDEPQIISVTKTVVEDGTVRHNVRTKFFDGVADLILQFGIDNGVLYLYGARVIDPGTDFDNDDITVPTVFFEPPVPCGDATTQLDADFATTAVTATIEISIDVGPKSIDGKVFVAGFVTARWNSVAPIDTPLGLLGDVGAPLAELQLNCDFTYSSDDSDINDAVDDFHTVKGVSGVLGPGVGFVQIDGQGSQQKIVNRVILPGDLVSNPAELDAFVDVPEGDLLSFSVDTLDVISVQHALFGIADGGITDGVVTLDDLDLEHQLNGVLTLEGQVSAAGSGPVDLVMVGKAKLNAATGGLKISLKGKTKKLDTFAKQVSFSVVQELLPPFDGATPLSIVYKAGKDPITKELITGTLEVPIAPFVASHMDVAVNLPVDIAKVKKGLLSIGTTKRSLGAEGVLTLGTAAEGTPLTFPILLKEKVTLKEGLPTVRAYSIQETGTTTKLLKAVGSSTSAKDFALTKLSGKLIGTKILPLIEDVVVASQ
ncbi:MAG TPA: hypothetical protein VFY71_11435 [Planctomycetota bacterium]|nr:hypothetical protein [Planctomycetota bacterium]